jgi:cellulose synthase operon protein C
MKTLLQSLLLVCLLARCQHLSAQNRNPYDAKVTELAVQLSSADELQKIVLLAKIYRLADYVDERPRILTILQRIANAPGEHNVVRAEANALAAELQGEPVTGAAAGRWYADETTQKRILSQAARLSGDASAEQYETLAELQYMSGAPGSAENMELSARRSPSAHRWNRAAMFTTDPFRKFADLQSALAIDPADPELNLQLSAYYIGRNQLEKARDSLTRASAAHGDDFVLRERLAELYLELGLRAEALRLMRQLQKEYPGPLWLKSRLAINYEQLGLRDEASQVAGSVLAVKDNDRGMLELLARFHEARHETAELKQDYLALSRLEPQNLQLWQKLALLQANTGDLDGARASLLHLLQLDSNQPGVHRQLADVYQRMHLEDQAQHELADATRSRLVAGPNTSRSGDTDFLVDPRAVARNAFLHQPSNGDVALADIHVQELYPDGLDRLHVQQIYFVGSADAVDAHRLMLVQYSPASEELQILHARTWKPGGQNLDAQDLGDRAQGDSKGSMYYDRRARQLRFTGLQPGDVVELEYSLSPVSASNPYGRYFGELMFFATPQPTELKRYILIAPAAETIYAHAEKLAPATVLLRNDSKTFIWEARHVAALVREPRSPGIAEVAPYVHVSTFANWRQLGSWYAELVRPQFALDRALEDELKRLLQGKHSEREKITSIQTFVSQKTHYVAQEFGVYNYKPYPVSETYARRFGDCKDKASLMIALLRAAGIEAQLALVRTRSLGEVSPQPASIAVFDHAIVYIPKYDLWLDGTAEYAIRELPLEDQGALALTIPLDGTAQLRHTPLSRPDDNYTKHTIEAELTSKGVIRFSGSTAARGEDAPGLRQELAVPEQQLDSVRRDLAQLFPTVEVYKVNVRDQQALSEEATDGEISVEFQGDLDSIRQKRIVSLSSSWIPRSYSSVLAASESRTEDLMLFAPWVTEEEIRIALPSGARVVELPRDKNISTAFGVLKLHYKKQSNAIVVQSRVQFNKSRVPALDYRAFRQFCIQTERSFAENIKVELPW